MNSKESIVSCNNCGKNDETTSLLLDSACTASCVFTGTIDCVDPLSSLSSSSSSQLCHCPSVQVLVEERNQLKAQLDRIQQELAVTCREKHQSAELGLQLLDQKDELQKRFDDLEHAYDGTRCELEAVRKALDKSLTSHKVSASTGIEQEEKLLKESAKKDATFASALAELEKELKSLRCELDRVQSEKETLLAEHCDMTKQLDIHEWERKSIRSELKDLKLRESRLLQELSEIEDENISLRKQVSTLRSSQIEFELAKNEIVHLQDELELRKMQVEEYESLKNIAEKQMLEALEALECEREEKYELKKKLDERMHFDCALGSLGLRFTSSSHSNDKFLKDSSNFTLHSITSSGNDEQFIIVNGNSKSNNSQRSRSSCISSSSFTYFDGKMNLMRDSFLNRRSGKRKTASDTNTNRCMSSDFIVSSLSTNCSSECTNDNCDSPKVSEDTRDPKSNFTRPDITSENNEKNNCKCQVNPDTINESLFVSCKLTSPSSLTSVTLTSGNSSGTPNSSLSVTPASTGTSSYINSSHSSPSLYSRSNSMSNCSTSPTPRSIVPIVSSGVVESSTSLSDDVTSTPATASSHTSTAKIDSSDSETSGATKGVDCNESNNSHANSYASCNSINGNNGSSSSSSYHTCYSSSVNGKTCCSDKNAVCEPGKFCALSEKAEVVPSEDCNKLCHLPGKVEMSSSSSDICLDNKSSDVDGKDSTIYPDGTLIDTVDYIKSNVCYSPPSDGNDEDRVECLSSNMYADNIIWRNDNLEVKCVPSNGDEKMSKCINTQSSKYVSAHGTNDNLRDGGECYSMSTSTSLPECNQSIESNNENIFNINTGAINLSQVKEVAGINSDSCVNNYSPSSDINNAIVSSSQFTRLNGGVLNDNSNIDQMNKLQEQREQEPVKFSHDTGNNNKHLSLKEDLQTLLTETDVSVTRNIHRYNNTHSDNKKNASLERPKSLFGEHDSQHFTSNTLLGNYLNNTPTSLPHSTDYFGQVNNCFDTATSRKSNSKSSDVYDTPPVIGADYKATTVMQSTGEDTSSKYHPLTTSISDASSNMAKFFPCQMFAASTVAPAATSTSSSVFDNLPSSKYSLRQSNSDYVLSNVYSSHSQVTCNFYPFSSEQLNSYINRKSNVMKASSITNCKDNRLNAMYSNEHAANNDEPRCNSTRRKKKMNTINDNNDNWPDYLCIDEQFKSSMPLSTSSLLSPYCNDTSNCIDVNREAAHNLHVSCNSKLNNHKATLHRKVKLISHNRCNKSKLLHQLKWLSCSTLNRESYILISAGGGGVDKKTKFLIADRDDSRKNYILQWKNISYTRQSTGTLNRKKSKRRNAFVVTSESDHLCALDSEDKSCSRINSTFYTGNFDTSLDSEFYSYDISTSGSGNSSDDCNHHHTSASSNNLHKVLNSEKTPSGCNDTLYARILPRSKRCINDDVDEKNVKLPTATAHSSTGSVERVDQSHIKCNVLEDNSSNDTLGNDKCNTATSDELLATGTGAFNLSANVLVHQRPASDEMQKGNSIESGVNGEMASKRLNRNENDNNCLVTPKSSTRNNISTGFDAVTNSANYKVKNKLPPIATIYSHDFDKIDKLDSIYSSTSPVDELSTSIKTSKFNTLSDSFHDNLANGEATDDPDTLIDTTAIHHTIPVTESLLSTCHSKNTNMYISTQNRSRSNVCLNALKATVRALAGCFLGLFAP